MSFCEYSSEVVSKNSVTIDNLFITDFLPNADGTYVKVYLYGLYLCSSGKENSIDNFEKNLHITREDIISIFYYWQEMGLVQVIETNDIIIRYLPTRNALQKMKKYNVDKYTSFNISAQELIGSKMLTPREFEEFYYLIENLGQEKEAVLKIIDFCVKQKGKNISVNYIVTVAKNWAYDGVKTGEDVDARILDQERISGDITLLLKSMGIRRQATQDEFALYLDWTREYEIANDLLVVIAKQSKAKNFKTLNDIVMKCYSLKLTSVKEINDYFALREDMLNLSKQVVKNLGLYYGDLNIVMDTYITEWLQLGFTQDAIIKLSNYAFKSSIRSLDGLNNQMQNMYKLGILTSDAIDNYMQDIVKNDKAIAQILQNLGIVRNVNSVDRIFYKTWMYDWRITDELLNYAVTKASGKYMPMQYLNNILATYHNQNITSVEEAQKIVTSVDSKATSTTTGKEAKKREYTKEELSSLFDSIAEIEI